MKIELTKTDRRLSALRFVVSAIAKESSRYAIQYVNIEPGLAVATDGRRLHIAHLQHNWEPGLYEVLKSTKTTVILLKSDEEAKFPAWRDIVPIYFNYFENGLAWEITKRYKIIKEEKA